MIHSSKMELALLGAAKELQKGSHKSHTTGGMCFIHMFRY